eukprot:scaffold1974_cov348-Pavlova_lutheri.AAC.2
MAKCQSIQGGHLKTPLGTTRPSKEDHEPPFERLSSYKATSSTLVEFESKESAPERHATNAWGATSLLGLKHNVHTFTRTNAQVPDFSKPVIYKRRLKEGKGKRYCCMEEKH